MVMMIANRMIYQMKKSAKQSGFTLQELVISLAIMGIIATGAVSNYKVEQKTSLVEKAAADVDGLTQAYNQFYTKNRRAPTSISELVTEGYYVGSTESPWGSTYVGTETANGYAVSVNTSDSTYAKSLSNKYASSSLSGTSVEVTTPIPTIETLASQYLHRVSVDGSPELNQLETDIDANGHNIRNISELDAEEVNVTTAVIEELITDRLTSVEGVEFVSGSIDSDGDTLTFTGNNLVLNGDVSLEGDLDANGNDITGVGSIEAESGEFKDLTSESLVATNATFTNFAATDAEIENANITNLRFDDATIGSLTFTDATGDSLNVTDLTTTNLQSVSVVADNATIANLKGTTLDYANGTIGSLSGTRIDYSTGTFDTANIASANATTVNATSINYNSAEFNSMYVGGELVADRGYFTSIESPSIDTDDLTASSIAAGTFDVDGTLTTTNLVATNATVSGTTTTNKLVSSTSNLGSASATSLSVSGSASANKITSTTGTFTTLNVNTVNGGTGDFNTLTSTNINGTNANFSNVTASKTTGGDFTGSNFTTSQSSVNSNHQLAESIKSEWDACVRAGGCQ